MDFDAIGRQTLERTKDLHQYIFRVLEANLQIARDELSAERPYDPWHFSHRVRYLTCCTLDSDDGPSKPDFSRVRQPLSALEISYRGYRVKVWKTTDGELPIPGSSEKRQQYMRQESLFSDFELYEVEQDLPMNLVLLWEVDASYGLRSMQLVCPRSFDSFWESGDSYFSIPVPHPADEIVPVIQFGEHSDIDIEVERKKAAGGERKGK